MKAFPFLLAWAACALAARADDTALLRQVADRWLAERDRWAFTQRVREFDGRTVRQERVERYDPSRRPESRWRLLAIDGRPPTPRQWAAWTERKNKPRRHRAKPAADHFDFARARVLSDTPTAVRYELPLRGTAGWLFPVSHVELIVTIAKAGPALEQVQARVAEPFRVALGVARVLDLDLDLQMKPPAPADPADAQPSGEARAVVTKLGARVEYAWSDFQRVTPHADAAEE